MGNEYEGDYGRNLNNELCRLVEIGNFRCPADAKEIDLIGIFGGAAAFRHGKAVIKSANKRARFIYNKITEMKK